MSKPPERRWTIYALQCPTCGVVRYVGQTKRPLAERLRKHISRPLNDELEKWFTNLRADGLSPTVVTLAIAQNHFEARRKENDWIAGFSLTFGRSLINRYGRGDYIFLTEIKRLANQSARRQREDARRQKLAEQRAYYLLHPVRKPRRYSLGKATGSISDWARKIGVSRERMRQRIDKCLKYKVNVSEALTTPAGETMPSFAGVKSWSRSKASR